MASHRHPMLAFMQAFINTRVCAVNTGQVLLEDDGALYRLCSKRCKQNITLQCKEALLGATA